MPPLPICAEDDDDVIAVDWGAFGLAPLGADVGYLALSEREDFDVLVDAYAEGARCDVVQARLGAQITRIRHTDPDQHAALRRAKGQ
ncbi:MAG: hypothetical protein V9E81_15075 [Marmoricola sp.]